MADSLGLSESQLLTLLLEGTADSLLVIDSATGQVLRASSGSCELLGYSLAELTGMCVTKLALNLPTIRHLRRRLDDLRTVPHSRIEGTLRARDGTLVLVESVSRYVAHGGQEVMIAVSRVPIVRTVPEPDVAQRAALLSTILSTMTEAVLVIDHQLTVVHANPQSAAVLLVPPENALGQPLAGTLRAARLEDDSTYDDFGPDLYGVQSGARTMQGVVVGFAAAGASPSSWQIVNAAAAPIRVGEPPGAVLTFTEVSELKRTESRLRQLVGSDELTGLPNRSALSARVHAGNARSPGRIVALLYLDLDGFKSVNDVFGHTVGDLLLIEVARRLRASTAASDFVARFGGDEFVVVLEGNDRTALSDRAEAVAGDLCRRLSSGYRIAGQDLVVSVSIGIAVSQTDRVHAESLLQRADMALYAAKAAGRDTFQFFTSMMDVRMQLGSRTVSAIRAGLDNAEFAVHLQPVATVSDSVVTGAECLLRWDAPGGLVSPSEFIPIAEDSGQIIPLGSWVFAEACRMWPVLQAMLPSGCNLAVNLSGRQLRRPGVLDELADTLKRGACDPTMFTVEITESTLIQDLRETTERLRALKDLGVRIAIDDFGTGYSSLTHLLTLPIDMVKIDQSFVAGVDRDPASCAIVRAVIDMAHAMDLVVVAEGVERAGQLAVLAELNCDSYQGYLLSRPAPLADFARKWGDRATPGTP